MSKQTSLALAEKIEPIDLKSELRKRFMWYAISTIVSRALPDVRDGLKPVHRRILYAMYKLRLTPEGRPRKSAAVVGDVLGKYHPHGDQAAYDALVRLAQDFSMRYPLIDGQGNFGSIDGDSAAAMRYTEVKLTPISMELLKEIEQNTVPFRPNYDSTLQEPILLPSRVPNLLINGSSGIAVGMATNVPPHNLTEVVNALIALIDRPETKLAELTKYIKGPDFPTGAGMTISKLELRRMYSEGKGSIKIRGDWNLEDLKHGKKQIVITSLPYTVNKSKLVEKIAYLIIEKKMQALTDVRDESTETIRIVLEPKTGTADINKIMAYIYRYTDLEYSFAANFTALDSAGIPRRMPLVEILSTFIEFRVDTTERRLRYDLEKILERLHILTALLKVLKDLDEAIRIIRKSKSRDEAKTALKKRFRLDDIQASAVLDLRLSSLVAMEVNKVRLETAELEAKREMLEGILKSRRKIKGVVKKELLDVRKLYGDKRRTRLLGSVEEEEEYRADDFIDHETCYVIASQNGWIRRIKSKPNEGQLRFKEGDSLLKIIEADTSEHLGFFSSAGKVYVVRAHDVSATTGFGDPIQSLFKFGDGERLVDLEHLTHIKEEAETGEEFLAVMENGMGLRFSRDSIMETTRSGRRFANVKGDNSIISVMPVKHPLVYIAHNGGKGLLFDLKEIPLLQGPGAGVRLIKMPKEHTVAGVKNVSKKNRLRLMFNKGRDSIVKISELDKGKRASAGRSYGGLKKKLIGLVIDG